MNHEFIIKRWVKVNIQVKFDLGYVYSVFLNMTMYPFALITALLIIITVYLRIEAVFENVTLRIVPSSPC